MKITKTKNQDEVKVFDLEYIMSNPGIYMTVGDSDIALISIPPNGISTTPFLLWCSGTTICPADIKSYKNSKFVKSNVSITISN